MVFGWFRRRAATDIHSMAGPDGILLMDEGANSFGIESRGKAQIRGNGCLALTSEEVLFAMWLPRRAVRIARSRVTAVERTTSHLGKSMGRALLRVRFLNDSGQPDAVAWHVRDLPAWEAALS